MEKGTGSESMSESAMNAAAAALWRGDFGPFERWSAAFSNFFRGLEAIDAEDGRDLLQDALADFLAKAVAGRLAPPATAPGPALLAYLSVQVGLRKRDLDRRRARREEVSVEDLATSFAREPTAPSRKSPSRRAAAKDDAAVVATALRSLTPNERELVASYVDRDVYERLCLSSRPDAVRHRRARVRKRLSARLPSSVRALLDDSAFDAADMASGDA